MDKKVVCVEWEDAGFHPGYYDEKNRDLQSPIIVETVGHLVKSNRAVIVVAADRYTYIDQPEDQRHISTIPKKMVRKITYLRGK